MAADLLPGLLREFIFPLSWGYLQCAPRMSKVITAISFSIVRQNAVQLQRSAFKNRDAKNNLRRKSEKFPDFPMGVPEFFSLFFWGNPSKNNSPFSKFWKAVPRILVKIAGACSEDTMDIL
jgi:hypothetical protein